MRIAGYELLSEVGRGGSGVVHRARASDGRVVAVKVLASLADPEQLAAFEREKRLLGALGEADGFVPILDSGAGPPFLVMPFLGGGTLRDRLAKGPLRVEDAVALATTLAHALGRAHERGIVHRDFKPANVLFTERGEPLVADLGLSKHFRRDVKGASQSGSLSATGLIAGTAGYMAPEQIDDSKRVGPPADVFALGCVLHEALAGTKPYEASSLLEYGTALAKGAPAPLRRLRPDVPRWLEEVVLRALAKDPARRFADGHAFARALAEGGAALRGARRGLVAGVAVLAVAGLAAGLGGPLLAARNGDRPRPPTPAPPAPPRPTSTTSPRSSEAIELTSLGVAAFERGDAKAAIEHLSKAIELDPKLARAWHRRAAVHFWLRDDAASALEDARKATELDRNDPDGWAELANAFGPERAQDALEAAERALALNPDQETALLTRARARIVLRDSAAAGEDLDRVAGHPGRVQSRALTHRGSLRENAGDFRRAIDDFTRALELGGPGTLEALGGRARCHLQLGELEAAEADFRRMYEEGPKEMPRDKLAAIRARILAQLGDRALQKGDTTAALEHYALGLELEPAGAKTLLEHAQQHIAQERFESAAIEAAAVIEARPGEAGAFALRGQARCSLGEKKGMEDLDRALELMPDRPELLMMRGTWRVRFGDMAGARADVDRAVARAPNDASARLTRAEILLGDEPAAALEDAARAYAQDPSLVGALLIHARAHARLGHIPEALADRRELERLANGRPAFLDLLRAIDAEIDRAKKKGLDRP